MFSKYHNMQRSHLLRCYLLVAATALPIGLLSFAGCSGPYESRLQAWTTRQEKVRMFEEQDKLDAELYGYSKLEGTDVWVRMPNRFKTVYNVNSKINGQPVPADRLQPPMLKMAGFRQSCEAATGDGVSYFLYYAALPIAQMNGQDIETLILEAVNGETESRQFEDFEVTDPFTKQKSMWRKVTVGTPQKFWQNNTPIQDNGKFELYLFKGQTYYVMVGWRYPEESGRFLGIDDLTMKTLGSIREGAPPPPPERPEGYVTKAEKAATEEAANPQPADDAIDPAMDPGVPEDDPAADPAADPGT